VAQEQQERARRIELCRGDDLVDRGLTVIASSAVDSFAEQVGVTIVAAVLLDHALPPA